MKVIRIDKVMELTSLPRSTIYLYIKENKFPKQIKLGERSVAWIENEIIQWIESRAQIRA